MTRGFWSRLATEWWVVAALSSVLVLALAHDRATGKLDTLVYDFLIGLDAREPDPRILLVTIDGPSLQEVGPWPWPRKVQARLLRGVAAGSPRAIAYDVLLLEEGGNRAGDDELAAAVAAAPPTFLPLLIDRPGKDGAAFDAVLPFEAVRRVAAGVGHVSLVADDDGLLRRTRLSDGGGGEQWPHLMELMHRASGDGRTPPARTTDPAAAPALIPFAGPPGHFPSISAAAILKGEVPAEVLAGRLVIVGATAQGLGDHHPISIGLVQGVMSGAEFQANILNGLLAGSFITEGGFAATAILALVPLWILLTGLRSLSVRRTMLLVVALAALALAVAAMALLNQRIWITPVPALAGLAVVYPFWGWRKLSAVSAHMRRQLEALSAESHALAPRAIQGAAADPVARQILLLEGAIDGLRDMRRFVSDSLDQLPDCVFVVDEDGWVLLSSRRGREFLESLGIREARPEIGAVFAHLRAGPDAAPRDTGRLIVGEWRQLEDGRQGEFWTRDGRCFDVRVGTRRDRLGMSVGRLVMFNEISEIQAARRQRQDLLNFLTHDMRSPQASIIATLATASPGEISTGIAERVERHARRTLELVDGFVQLARAEMPRYRLEILDLSDLLIDAVDDVWPQARARGMNVRTTGDDREWLVEGERSLLTRAIVNILDNAIKYGPDDSEIRCELSAGGIDGKPAVRCSVSDSGPGIAAAQIDTMFQRFRRADHAERIPGAGLGLTLVQTVVARHQGLVECSSAFGKGSTFTLALPLCEPGTEESSKLR